MYNNLFNLFLDLITKNDNSKIEKKNFKQENKNLLDKKRTKTTANILKTSSLIYKHQNFTIKNSELKIFYKEILSRIELLNFTIKISYLPFYSFNLKSCNKSN